MKDVIHSWSLAQCCAALAAGDTSSVQLTEAALARIAELNQTLGAYWHVAADAALEQAARSDMRRAQGHRLQALDGIPLSIKDSVAVQGMPWTGGFGYRRAVLADTDAHVVKRLRGQGAVMLGKTSMDEGSFGTSGVNAVYGDCVHPMFPGCSAGGSSSGAAVSVATGMAVYALGTDGMGSARIPAALCGVAGFKPSQGRVSQRGVLPGSRRLDCVGVLARYVRDLQLPYHAIAGLDTLDAMSRVTPLRHLELSRWRLASVPPESLPGLSEPVARVYLRALERLQQSGYEGSWLWSQQTLGQHDFQATRRDGLLLMCAEMAVVHGAALQAQDASGVDSFSPWLRRLLEFPGRRSAVDLMAADRRIDAVVVYMRQVFAQADVLVLPTIPLTTHPLGQQAPDNMADYTALASLAGLPALSLPCGTTAEGHPVGLQLIGPAGSDLLLLMLGARWQDLLEA